MTDTQSPFRLIQPSQQLYEADPGEVTALRGINEQNIGGLYGLLLEQRARGRANQDRYGDLLGSINAQQAALAREKLASDNFGNELKFRGDMVQHGGVDVAAALSGLNLGGLPSPYTPEQAGGSLITTDGLRRALTAGKAYEAQMTGAQRGAEAGYTVDPGQVLPATAAAAQRTTLTTGAPMDVVLKGMDLQGDREKRAAAGTGLKARTEIDPATGQSKVVFEDKDNPVNAIHAQEAYDQWSRLNRRHNAQPTLFPKPPPFQLPTGMTPLASGAPTEGQPLTQEGNGTVKTAAGSILDPTRTAGNPALRNVPPELAGDLPPDNRRPSTGTVAGTNVQPTPPQRTVTGSAPPITDAQVNKAKAAVATRGKITGWDWSPQTGRRALYANGAPLRLDD